MLKQERLFCSKPFEWFEVTQLDGRGGTYLCCPSWLDTRVGNLRTQTVEEIWNGAAAQAIRKSILDGSFEYCNASRCPFLQTRSGPVQTVSEVEDGDLRAAIQERRVVLPYGPKKIICTYDQSCNLSCPSCRTELIVESDKSQEILDIQHKLETQAGHEAEFLLITGSGDPFGSPFFRKWIQKMRREAMPKLAHIHLHSNGLLWTRSMWNTIPSEIRALIKSCEISIDAAQPKTYALNRRGGNLPKLLDNLEFISELRSSGPLEMVKISMVVQANNFREMPAFVDLGKRLQFDVVYFSQLVNWGTFSETEFKARAVHLPSHEAHHEFILSLQSEILHDAIVDLGNLTHLQPSYSDIAKRRLVGFTGKLLRKFINTSIKA